MDGQGELAARLDRLEQRMDEQFNHLMRSMEQLVHMVAENNRGLADLRTTVAENSRAIADVRTIVADNAPAIANLRTEVAALNARATSLEEHIKGATALWQAESRHFAHTVGELQRDVFVLKER